MKTENYNLVDEDWIPVLMKDGTHKHVSLGEMFANGEVIADLSMVAYERISVMRLLICIAMAALDEKDLADEAAWRASRTKISGAVAAYFAKWHDRFNFYGPHAFMQPDGLTIPPGGKAAKIDKVVIALSSGNGGTLFDHGACADVRKVEDDVRVRSMLSYLNFSAGGQHPKCAWDGIETPVSVTAGPLRERCMVHTFLCGSCISETIWMNLLTTEMISSLPPMERGRPLWECDSLGRSSFADGVAPTTLFARLVPLSRVMKFSISSDFIPLGNGLKYSGLPSMRVFEAAVRTKTIRQETELTYVSLSLEEAPWRNLHSILAQDEHCGSLVIRHTDSTVDDTFTIWSGGLLTDGKAKDIAALEWRFTMPRSMLNDDRLKFYQVGVEFAKTVSDRWLYDASRHYYELMKIDPKKSGFVLPRARQSFWDTLEKEQSKLVRIVTEEGDMAEWKRVVIATAKNAFELSCPHQTGRQMSAYVQALGKLTFRKKEGKDK